MIKNKFWILFVVIFLISCNKSGHKQTYDEYMNSYNDSILSLLKSKEFVYIDNDSVVHIQLQCGIPRFHDEEYKKVYCVKRLPTNCLIENQLNRCCPVCIDDDTYKYLKNLTDSIYEDKINPENVFSKYGGKVR
jgi:hypothetical protein